MQSRKGRLAGKVALITGGTSGIGLATAELFLKEGAEVALSGRSRTRGQEALRHLGRHRRRAIFIQGDVAKAADASRMVRATLREFGRLDILVNNAGVFLERRLDQTTEEEWDFMLDTNLKGAYLVAKAAVEHMSRRGGGSIVNVASDAGLVGNYRSAAYCASKGGLVLLTKAMALDHASQHIRVNCVCPGIIETPMFDREIAAASDPKRYRDETLSFYPLGRPGRPEEVARAILFLAAESSAYVTGAALVVDGGATAI